MKKHFCKVCNKSIGKWGEGHCRKHGIEKAIRTKKRTMKKCIACHKNRVAHSNKSGICHECKMPAYKKREMRQCKSLNRERKKNLPIMVTCHSPDCKRKFYLESWQHPQMAWCILCRNGEIYQNYRTLEKMGLPLR